MDAEHESRAMRAQIQQALVQSGHYEKISNELNQQLLNDGWVNEVKALTRQEMEKTGSTNFVEILAKVEPQALNMVNEKTKAVILQSIKSFLNDIVEV